MSWPKLAQPLNPLWGALFHNFSDRRQSHQTKSGNWLTDGPRHTKLTFGHKHANIIKNLNTTLSNNRQDYRTAVHLITGHCGLNKHLHNIGKSNTSACPMCGDEEETVSHFLGQCPAITQIRGQYFQDYYLSVNDIFDNQHDISPPLSISQTAPNV